MNFLPTTIILAGGLGSRLKNLTKEKPKAMIKINNKPFIYHQLNLLKQKKIKNVVICTGHFSNLIQEYVGNGRDFGLNVKYSYDGKNLLGTGGAVKKATQSLQDYFFILYGDSYLDISFEDLYKYYLANGKKPVMSLIKNNNMWDKSNIIFNKKKITCYEKNSKNKEMQYIDYGLSILNKSDFEQNSYGEIFDLSELFTDLARENKLLGYEYKKRFYEIGSTSGINDLSLYLKNRGE